MTPEPFPYDIARVIDRAWADRKKSPMARDDWDAQVFALDAIRTLAAAYEQEHDWDADTDPVATRELLADARALHARLLSQLGEPKP